MRGSKTLVRIEQRRPNSHQRTLIEGKGQGVLRRRRMHGRETEQVRLDRARIGIRHIGVTGKGHRRVELGVVGPDALVHRVQKIGIV